MTSSFFKILFINFIAGIHQCVNLLHYVLIEIPQQAIILQYLHGRFLATCMAILITIRMETAMYRSVSGFDIKEKGNKGIGTAQHEHKNLSPDPSREEGIKYRA